MGRRLSFLGHFAGEKGNQALDGFISHLAKFDPETASAADIALLEDEVKNAARLKVEAALEIKGLNETIAQLNTDKGQALQALSIRRNEYDSAPEGEKENIKARAAVISHQVDIIEEQLTHQHESLNQANEWLTQVSQALEEAAQSLGSAKTMLEDAKRQMKMAERDRELAENAAARSRQLSNMKGATTHIGVALGAMRDAADKDRKEAAVVRETANAIGQASTSGMSEVRKVLEANKPKVDSDPFARLKPRENSISP